MLTVALSLYTDKSGGRSCGLVLPYLLRIFQFIVKGFDVVNKAKVDVFLEFSCSFNDPIDFGNLISGCSAFSKSSLNIGKFSVHIPVET